MTNLDHVRWVGGGSGAGKTALTLLCAERFECNHYSTDESLKFHSARLGSTEAPLLEHFRSMNMDERWVQSDPATMYAKFPWFHGEGFDLLVEDLERMPTDRPLLVEGFRLRPHLVRPYVSDPKHAVWLVATSDFRQAVFERRRDANAFWMHTSDPDRALSNLLERDRIFADEVVRDAEQNHLEVLYVDGTQTIEDRVIDLASRFDLA